MAYVPTRLREHLGRRVVLLVSPPCTIPNQVHVRQLCLRSKVQGYLSDNKQPPPLPKTLCDSRPVPRALLLSWRGDVLLRVKRPCISWASRWTSLDFSELLKTWTRSQRGAMLLRRSPSPLPDRNHSQCKTRTVPRLDFFFSELALL